MNGPTHTVGSHSDDRGGEQDTPKCKRCGGDGFTSEHGCNPNYPESCAYTCPVQVQCEACEATGLEPPQDTSLDDLLDLYTYEITKRGSDGDSSRKAIKAWHTTQQKALLKRVREEVIGKTPKRSDDPQQLDELIDIESKQFMRWSQKDIAHFFERVGAMYRNLSNQLNEGGE